MNWQQVNREWEVNMMEKNILTFNNALVYSGYRIYHSGNGWVKFNFTHQDYDGPEDNRTGTGESIEDCIHKINEYILENEVDNS